MLEQGKSVLQKQVQVTAQTLTNQLTGSGTTPTQPPGGSQHQPPQDASTKDFLSEMYGTTYDQKQKPQQTVHQNQSVVAQVVTQLKGPDSQDAEKMAQIRKQLLEQHKTSYYDPLVTRPKQEEHVADKLEREDQEEKQKRWELQQKEKEKAPIALTMAKNKAEQFPGAAG